MPVKAGFGCKIESACKAPPLSKSEAGSRREIPAARTRHSAAKKAWRFREANSGGMGEESSNLRERQGALERGGLLAHLLLNRGACRASLTLRTISWCGMPFRKCQWLRTC